MENKKNYPSLDIAKFIMAMLILTQHTSNEWAHSTGLVHAFFGLGNFAVPFFFACSGFLFFSKFNLLNREDQKTYYKKWSVRIGKMYMIWSLIYFCFILAGWIDKGITTEGVIRFLHKTIVFSTYATIWFLPALWVGISICYWLKRHCSSKYMWIIILGLLVIGNLFGSYSNLMTTQPIIASFNDWYTDTFITWRNGIFNGAPFVFVGILIAEGKGKKLSIIKAGTLTCIFCLTFIAEAYAIIRFQFSTMTDMGFMMVPAIYFMMLTLEKMDIKQNTLWTHCRNLSMLIFLSQRLFLSAIPGVLQISVSERIKSFPEPCIYLFFVILVLGFSITIEHLSTKYKFLKILW